MPAVTGIFSETLTYADFDDSAFSNIAVTMNNPVSLYYKVLPGNEVAFGSGANAFQGVRTAKCFRISPYYYNGSEAKPIKCKYTLSYIDVNQIRESTIRRDLTENVKGETSNANQFNYLPETTGYRVGAYAYLKITLQALEKPTDTDARWTNGTIIEIPITRYTLQTATGE